MEQILIKELESDWNIFSKTVYFFSFFGKFLNI